MVEMPFKNVTDPWPHHALSSLDYIYIITMIVEIPLKNGANPCRHHVLPQYCLDYIITVIVEILLKMVLETYIHFYIWRSYHIRLVQSHNGHCH